MNNNTTDMDANGMTSPTNLIASILCWGFYGIGKLFEDIDTYLFHSLQYVSFALSITVAVLTIRKFWKESKKRK
jgi:hypothetical protein